MEFQKLVEELMEDDIVVSTNDKKKGIIAANFTTKTGIYASAQVGTSAGVLAPNFQTASVQAGTSANNRQYSGAELDVTTTKKTNASTKDPFKNSFKPCKSSDKVKSKKDKDMFPKYKSVDFGGKL